MTTRLRLLAPSVLLVLSAAPLLGQNVLFSEGFTAGIPATWSHLTLATSVDVWSPGLDPITNNPTAFHEWFCHSGLDFRDNILVTPRIDLSGFTFAEFRCKQHQIFPLQRMLNRVEVSTNGGLTFTPVYTETGTWSGPGFINISLNQWAGLSDVRIGFHYQGFVANEWHIDDVRVTTPQSVLDVQNVVAGFPTNYSITGAEPISIVAIGVSLAGAGPIPTPWGTLYLTPEIFIPGFIITDQ